jgi:hypothetical protein
MVKYILANAVLGLAGAGLVLHLGLDVWFSYWIGYVIGAVCVGVNSL